MRLPGCAVECLRHPRMLSRKAPGCLILLGRRRLTRVALQCDSESGQNGDMHFVVPGRFVLLKAPRLDLPAGCLWCMALCANPSSPPCAPPSTQPPLNAGRIATGSWYSTPPSMHQPSGTWTSPPSSSSTPCHAPGEPSCRPRPEDPPSVCPRDAEPRGRTVFQQADFRAVDARIERLHQPCVTSSVPATQPAVG
jgi:hypothetical protein